MDNYGHELTSAMKRELLLRYHGYMRIWFILNTLESEHHGGIGSGYLEMTTRVMNGLTSRNGVCNVYQYLNQTHIGNCKQNGHFLSASHGKKEIYDDMLKSELCERSRSTESLGLWS